MYILMCERKERNSDKYVLMEYSGIKHLYYKEAVAELNEARRLNPYTKGIIYIKEA